MMVFVRRIFYRKKFRRIYELRSLVQDPLSPTACFPDLDNRLLTNRIARKTYRDLERQLQGLDSGAWNFLKEEVMPLLTIKDSKRGWTQLFNKLNQANAYNYLASIGCKDIKFIPRANDQQTPDLQARLLSRMVLCEVKTINVSEIEAGARTHNTVRNIEFHLGEGFFNKFQSDLDKAKNQMTDYCCDSNSRQIVYFVINFDDLLHEYVENYSNQIKQYTTDHATHLEIVLDMKPAYYTASS
jgi:hypothetical protein